MANERAARRGDHYTDAEIALVYMFARSDEARELLAKLLDRTKGGVDMVWRWCDHAGFPSKSDNQIKRQVERIEQVLGQARRGIVDVA